MQIAQPVCYGILIILALVTTVNALREMGIFVEFMKFTALLWVLSGPLTLIFAHLPLTFGEWLVGGGITFFGGSAILFNLFVFVYNRVDQWESQDVKHHSPTPDIETVYGEVMDENPELNARNPQRNKLLPAIARNSRKVRVTGRGPFGPVIHMPLSDWQTCENIPRAHWHTHLDGEEVCEGE